MRLQLGKMILKTLNNMMVKTYQLPVCEPAKGLIQGPTEFRDYLEKIKIDLEDLKVDKYLELSSNPQ